MDNSTLDADLHESEAEEGFGFPDDLSEVESPEHEDNIAVQSSDKLINDKELELEKLISNFKTYVSSCLNEEENSELKLKLKFPRSTLDSIDKKNTVYQISQSCEKFLAHMIRKCQYQPSAEYCRLYNAAQELLHLYDPGMFPSPGKLTVPTDQEVKQQPDEVKPQPDKQDIEVNELKTVHANIIQLCQVLLVKYSVNGDIVSYTDRMGEKTLSLSALKAENFEIQVETFFQAKRNKLPAIYNFIYHCLLSMALNSKLSNAEQVKRIILMKGVEACPGRPLGSGVMRAAIAKHFAASLSLLNSKELIEVKQWIGQLIEPQGKWSQNKQYGLLKADLQDSLQKIDENLRKKLAADKELEKQKTAEEQQKKSAEATMKAAIALDALSNRPFFLSGNRDGKRPERDENEIEGFDWALDPDIPSELFDTPGKRAPSSSSASVASNSLGNFTASSSAVSGAAPFVRALTARHPVYTPAVSTLHTESKTEPMTKEKAALKADELHIKYVDLKETDIENRKKYLEDMQALIQKFSLPEYEWVAGVLGKLTGSTSSSASFSATPKNGR